MNKKKLFVALFLFLLTVVTFRAWFGNGILSSTDLDFNLKLPYSYYFLYPFAWYSDQASGLGGSSVALLWIYLYFAIPITIFGKIIGMSWVIIERISFFYPFLILSFISSTILFKKIFKNNILYLISPIIFLFNTYILMVVGGGQVLVALSYAFSPLVLYFFIKLTENYKNKKILLITSLILSLQILVDPRFTYIVIIAAVLYLTLKKIIEFKNNKRFYLESLISLIYVFVIPGVISLLIHSFWLLPTIINHQNPIAQLGTAFSTVNAVNYFSFAKFENTISLLHPNWPENIFGKVYFMRWEFLLIPILAYASLFFIKRLKSSRERIYVIYFALLGLVGAFLAKGSNDPFGGIYLWLFNHFPGFQMYRDPTKWYTLVAISYSILIPFTVWQIYEFLKLKTQNLKFKVNKCVPSLFILLVFLYLFFLIRPALFGQLNGTFKPTLVPNEYITLENFLSSQNNFSRTFWVPITQRFGFYSSLHPAVSAQDFFNLYNDENLLKKINSSENLIQESGIRYIIVPYDSEGEIFLQDRKYSEKEYQKTIDTISKITWLKEIKGFGRIKVFEVLNPKDHFWLSDVGQVKYKYISPVEYQVILKNVKKGELLVFSESFDKKWEIRGQKPEVRSQKFDSLLNSFQLQKGGDYSLRIYYQPQDWVNIGVVVSILSLASVLGLLIFGYTTKKW